MRSRSSRELGHNPFMSAEFLALYRAYETSGKALLRALAEEFQRLETVEGPGPRRQIDFTHLNMLRRFHERDAYKVFTWRPNMRAEMPPSTPTREIRGLLKDVMTTQYFGRFQVQGQYYLDQAKAKLKQLCKNFWQKYQQSPEPRSHMMQQRLVEIATVAQGLDMEGGPVLDSMWTEINRLSLR